MLISMKHLNSVLFLLFVAPCKKLRNEWSEINDIWGAEMLMGGNPLRIPEGRGAGAHRATLEECPVSAGPIPSVSWYISIAEQGIVPRGRPIDRLPTARPEPLQLLLRSSRLQPGCDQGRSSHGFETFGAVCYRAACARCSPALTGGVPATAGT